MGRPKKTATVILPAAKKSIVQWCKEQYEQGNELALVWDGGGDSGWCYFEMDGDTVENEYTEALVDHMYDTLNYGSWAGEFQANGRAIYDPKTNSFEGTDYYGEDGNDVLEVDWTIRVPKKFWFNTLHVEVECNYDDVVNVDVRFIVRNGFISNEHESFTNELESNLKKDFSDLFDGYESNHNHEFRGCNDSWILERADAIEGEEELIFKITRVDVQTIENEDRPIVLELDEQTAEFIDNRLNEK